MGRTSPKSEQSVSGTYAGAKRRHVLCCFNPSFIYSALYLQTLTRRLWRTGLPKLCLSASTYVHSVISIPILADHHGRTSRCLEVRLRDQANYIEHIKAYPFSILYLFLYLLTTVVLHRRNLKS
jgi:hypothetical protein